MQGKTEKSGSSRLEKAEKTAMGKLNVGDLTITEQQEINGKQRMMIVNPSAAQKYANKFAAAVKPSKDVGPKLHIKYSRIDRRKAAMHRKVYVPKDPMAEKLAKLKMQAYRIKRHSGAVRFIKAFDTDAKVRRTLCIGASEKLRNASREHFDTLVKELAQETGKKINPAESKKLELACVRSNSALTGALYSEAHDPVLTLVKASSNRYQRPPSSGLRKSIVPGRVCIMLKGPYQGYRVVVLKDKGSGEVLVTGPRPVNGVPILVVNQIYLIATSVRLPISGLKVPAEVDCGVKVRSRKRLNSAQAVDGATQKQLRMKHKRQKVREAIKRRRPFQKFVDAQVVEVINRRPDSRTLKSYLRAKFGLKGHDRYFHNIKFL